MYLISYIILYYTKLDYSILLYYIILYYSILYYIILYHIVSYILYYTILYYIILYDIILYYIIWYYMILYYIISIMCIYLWSMMIHDDPWLSHMLCIGQQTMFGPFLAMKDLTEACWTHGSLAARMANYIQKPFWGIDGVTITRNYWFMHIHVDLCWFGCLQKNAVYPWDCSINWKTDNTLETIRSWRALFSDKPVFPDVSQSFVWLFSVYYFENVLQLFDIVWCYQVWLNVRISSKPTNMIEDCVKLGTSHFIVAMNCRSDLSCFRSYQSGLNM